MTYKSKRILPAFRSEAEEAEWWYEHREELAEDFTEAVRTGQLGEGTRGRLARIQEQKAKERLTHEPVVSAK